MMRCEVHRHERDKGSPCVEKWEGLGCHIAVTQGEKTQTVEMTHHGFCDLSDEIWLIILMMNSIKTRQYNMSFVASSHLLKIILHP